MESIQTFKNVNKFNSGNYYVVFNWDMGHTINTTSFKREFDSENTAERAIKSYIDDVSRRMSGNASRREAYNTLSSFTVKKGSELNTMNVEFYENSLG